MLSVGWKDEKFGSISVSGQLPIYPSPNPTLTLTCDQFGLGEGRWAIAQILILIQKFDQETKLKSLTT